MAEAEYMEKKKSREFENLRIQLAAQVAKSKAQVKILETPSEVADDAQATLKSETSYLHQLQTEKEVKGKSQKESELNSKLREREKCDANLGITRARLGCHLMQIESHVMKDCIQGVIETLGIQMKMTSWFIWQEVAVLLKGKTLRKPHVMHYVSFFNCRQLQRWIWNSLMAIL